LKEVTGTLILLLLGLSASTIYNVPAMKDRQSLFTRMLGVGGRMTTTQQKILMFNNNDEKYCKI
jgi:hypothetical protein